MHSGIEADQKVVAAHKCYAMTATTAMTAQNTLHVRQMFHVPPYVVKGQIEANLEDIGADVVKIGRYIVPQYMYAYSKSQGCWVPRT